MDHCTSGCGSLRDVEKVQAACRPQYRRPESRLSLRRGRMLVAMVTTQQMAATPHNIGSQLQHALLHTFGGRWLYLPHSLPDFSSIFVAVST